MSTKDWREGIQASACARFSTVLGPGSDGAHEEHIHLDLAERRNNYKICEWDVRAAGRASGGCRRRRLDAEDDSTAYRAATSTAAAATPPPYVSQAGRRISLGRALAA